MSDEEDTPRKGRSNAILTYETVSSIEKNVLEVGLKLDHVSEKMEDMKRLHMDHEVRIKALELSQASTIAASTSTSNLWVWIIGTAVTVPGAITALVSLLRFFGGGA